MLFGSKRVIRCEEWSKLQIGKQGSRITPAEIESIFSSWYASTGTDPAKYFDISAVHLVPKFWSGTLHCTNFVLEVLPIGGLALSPELKGKLDSSLSLMVETVAGSVSIRSTEGGLSSGGSRIDVLLAAFCRAFRLARRIRIIRRYTSEAREGRTFCGRLVFPRQAILEISAPGTFASQALRFTEDTAENRLIAAVLRRFRAVCSPAIRRNIDVSLGELEGVGEARDVSHEWPQIRFDRLPHEYTVLLRQARALLAGNFAGVFEGEVVATAEIIFTSRLFERYVAGEFTMSGLHFGHKVQSQNRGSFLCRNSSDKRSFELIPDLIIRNGNRNVLAIADTKWKRIDEGRPGFGVYPEDIYQSLIYAAHFGCSKVALVFPNMSSVSGHKLIHRELTTTLRGSDYSIQIIGLPMLSDLQQGCRRAFEKLLETTGGCPPVSVDVAQANSS